MFGFCNMWVCVCVDFVMCVCVCVCMFGFCNMWVCVCVGFVMSGYYGNMCTCIYCVLYCLYCVFLFFLLCIFILICFVWLSNWFLINLQLERCFRVIVRMFYSSVFCY